MSMIDNQHKLGLCMNLILHSKVLVSICMWLEIFCKQQLISLPSHKKSFQNKCLQLNSIHIHHLSLHYCKLSTSCKMSMQPRLHNLYQQPHILSMQYIEYYPLYLCKPLTYIYLQYYRKYMFHQFPRSKMMLKDIMHKQFQ